jgi:hypothetical protein
MTELKENAKYGRFAFDHYVLVRPSSLISHTQANPDLGTLE